MNSRSVAGSVVHITGAASGMGRATAEVFAAEGAHVALSDRSTEAVNELAADLVKRGYSAAAWTLELSDEAAIVRVTNEIAEKFGGIDVIVNNAGLSAYAPIDDPNYEVAWERGITVMLAAPQRIIRASLPWLRKSKAARIVNIASTEALGATALVSAYSAAKAGLTGLTRALAVELGPEGITVNCICPGPILTGLTTKIEEKDRQTFARRRTALRRYGEPEEVAHMTLSLSLPAASYITGATIPVDGGLMARNA
jgi:3-oxoacyl-[acyl-carrier protein] reductase